MLSALRPNASLVVFNSSSRARTAFLSLATSALSCSSSTWSRILTVSSMLVSIDKSF
nr:MAG TPA: hypothetical protein [Caudoviricetes sp.]